MSDSIISVENLSKKYLIRHERQGNYTNLRDVIANKARQTFKSVTHLIGRPSSNRTSDSKTIEEFWALKDVSFEIKQGEVVGIIGRNGAGKSTLLKILSRITEPTTGSVKIKGRVASLLEVGTGFHPELTGRENIFLNGAILGMTKAEIKRKFDEIVAFAEIEKFLDTPVKRYSSGMYVRLAFAVAAHLEPEILLVDEVLAVGDAAFQKKCLGKMGDVAKKGRTVLFVSHNMAAVTQLCAKTILIKSGQLAGYAATSDIVPEYLASSSLESRDNGKFSEQEAKVLRKLEILDEAGRQVQQVLCGNAVRFRIHYGGLMEVEDPLVYLSINTIAGIKVTALSAGRSQGAPLKPIKKEGFFDCEVPSLPLAPGLYRINLAFFSGSTSLDHLIGCAELQVVPSNFNGRTQTCGADRGVLVLQERWSG